MRWRLALPLAALAALSAAAPAFGVVAQASDKPAATISLRYTAPPSDSVARTVVLKALGPAPAASTTLVDEEGRTAVRARVQAPLDPACRVTHIRDTGLGDDRWCLQLEDIWAGSEVTGKLSGPKSVVTLKVAARHGLRLPVLVAVLVLLIAAGFVFYNSNLMGERVNRLLLDAQLRRKSSVDCLRTWVEQAKDYLSYARIRSLVAWMRDRGPQRTARARASLMATEQKVGENLPDCPLRRAARDEAARATVSAKDLVSPNGEILDHPATRLEDALLGAAAQVENFDSKVDALMPSVPEDRKSAAEALKRKAHAELATITIHDVDSTLPEMLNQHVAQIRQYTTPGVAGGFLAGTGVGLSTSVAPPTVRDRLVAAADVVAASAPVVIAIVVLMVVATIAALSASYAPKRTFGTAWDYAALGVAVFGSTSVAGIAAAALLWRRTQPHT
jgi:hypothetical protein